MLLSFVWHRVEFPETVYPFALRDFAEGLRAPHPSRCYTDAVAKTIHSPRVPARFVEPMQCLAVAKLPEGPDWEYEIKFDGYRALGIKSAGRVRLLSRNGNDFSARFPSVANALSKLPDDSVVDGEIVALDETGRPSFNVLQNYNHAATPLQFYVFDLLHLAGKNLRSVCHLHLWRAELEEKTSREPAPLRAGSPHPIVRFRSKPPLSQDLTQPCRTPILDTV